MGGIGKVNMGFLASDMCAGTISWGVGACGSY